MCLALDLGLPVSGTFRIQINMRLNHLVPSTGSHFSITFGQLDDILDNYMDEFGFDSYLALYLGHICLDLS